MKNESQLPTIMTNPLISIITVNLNNNVGLQKTINSIEQQSFASYEHIIIDGGSTDESVETISTYSRTSSHLTYCISEKDSGVYNAMNKGIAQANGEYLLFLNSGDFLETNILNRVSEQLTGEEIVYADLYLLSSNGERRLESFPSPPFSAIQLIASTFYLPHPASFIKRKLFEKEKYSEQYKIVSDWEFWIKNLLLRNCTIKHIPVGISNFADGGLSSIVENQTLIHQEREDVFNNLLSHKILESLRELAAIQQSPLYAVITETRHTTRFQHRMKKICLFCYRIRCLFQQRIK